MFQPGDIVQIIASEFHPNLVGKRGHIIDEAPPFNGIWAVHGIPGLLNANSGGFYAHELRKVGHDRSKEPKRLTASRWW